MQVRKRGGLLHAVSQHYSCCVREGQVSSFCLPQIMFLIVAHCGMDVALLLLGAFRTWENNFAGILLVVYTSGMDTYDSAIERRRNETIGERIRRRRRQLGMSQSELAAGSNVNQGYISQIERGLKEPRRATLNALAVALSLPQGVLVGGGEDHDAPQPLETRELPLLGTIPAGPPSRSQEQLEMFPVLRHQWSPDYYCLRLSYDSMEPTLKPGDVVLVHYRPDVNPEHVQGRICACLIDTQATLKRVSVEWQGDRKVIILRGDNPRVPPMLIDDSHEFSIQGIVVQLVAREL